MSHEDKITFCTTGMLRPKILERTYSSFSKNLVGIDLKKCKLILNIDPLPVKNNKESVRGHIMNVAQEYFGEVEVNWSKTANHTNAVKTVWSKVKTPYIFHLQDDWELYKKVNIDDMFKVMEDNPNVHEVMLMRKCNKCPNRVGFPPCLLSEKFFKGLPELFDSNMACEYQMQKIFSESSKFPKHPNGLDHRCLRFFPNKKRPVIIDIGRKWMKANGYDRGKHDKFITWRKR